MLLLQRTSARKVFVRDSVAAYFYQRGHMAACRAWAVIFIPMPMSKTVCGTNMYNKLVQLEVCIFLSGRGMV